MNFLRPLLLPTLVAPVALLTCVPSRLTDHLNLNALPPEEPQRPRPSGLSRFAAASSGSALIPGTDVAVQPQLLPPVPEDENEASLDTIGQAAGPEVHQELPPQDPRTGGNLELPMAGAEVQQELPPQDPRTGMEAPMPSTIPRQTSSMSTEPEPQPMPLQVPPARSPQALFRDPDGYAPVRSSRPSTETPYRH